MSASLGGGALPRPGSGLRSGPCPPPRRRPPSAPSCTTAPTGWPRGVHLPAAGPRERVPPARRGPGRRPHRPGADVPFQYARWATPTWSALEAALGALEDADVAVVPSGMAAIAAVLLPLLHPGDRALLPADGYGPTRALAAEHLTPRGVHVDLVATQGLAHADLSGYDLVLVETLQPGAARGGPGGRRRPRPRERPPGRRGALVVVDNTLLTPWGGARWSWGRTWSWPRTRRPSTGTRTPSAGTWPAGTRR